MLLRQEFEVEQGICLTDGKDAAQLQAEGAGSSVEECLCSKNSTVHISSFILQYYPTCASFFQFSVLAQHRLPLN